MTQKHKLCKYEDLYPKLLHLRMRVSMQLNRERLIRYEGLQILRHRSAVTVCRRFSQRDAVANAGWKVYDLKLCVKLLRAIV